MTRLQVYLQRVRQSQAAGRSRQAQRAAAAHQGGPRPRVGPRTPAAVAANPEAATAPRSGAGRSAVTVETRDPLANFNSAGDVSRLNTESEWSGNLLDSAARAGLRSPGLALDGRRTADGDRLWPDVQTVDGPGDDEAAEEAEDTVYGGAMRHEELFYRGPVRSDDPDDVQSPRPITASAQLLEEPDSSEPPPSVAVSEPATRQARRVDETSSQQPEYLAGLLRLGRDFVYLPGLSAMTSSSGDRDQTTRVTPEVTGSELPGPSPREDGAGVVYVYIVRGDGQTLDLYATNGRAGEIRPDDDDVTYKPRRAADVLGHVGANTNQNPNGGVNIDENKIDVTAKDLESAADSSADLLSIVEDSENRGTASTGGQTEDSELSTSISDDAGDVEITEDKYSKTAVYFDPANELLLFPETENKLSVHGKSAESAVKQEDESTSAELLPEDRGIFFFPGNVIHSFGLAPSGTSKSPFGLFYDRLQGAFLST